MKKKRPFHYVIVGAILTSVVILTACSTCPDAQHAFDMTLHRIQDPFGNSRLLSGRNKGGRCNIEMYHWKSALRFVKVPRVPISEKDIAEATFVMLEVAADGLGNHAVIEKPSFIDPWGTPYKFTFEEQYQKVYKDEISVYVKITIHSFGPNKRDNNFQWDDHVKRIDAELLLYD